MSRNDFQSAYVTTDIDRAMAEISRLHAIGGFMQARGDAYADARADLGRHLESFAFPEGSHLDAAPRY